MKSYEDIISSTKFRADLKSLNNALAKALRSADEPVAINGNVCYSNLQEDFHISELSLIMEPKRRALMLLAQRSSCFVEVGVAGGHALLVALHANQDIKCIGIDLAQRLRPSWPPVDIFVPATFEWFRSKYPERVILLQDEAISGLKKVAEEQQFGAVDLLHLDGDKRSRFEELRTIWPALADNAYLLQGDTKNGHVVADTKNMIAQGLAKPTEDKELEAIGAKNFQCLEIGKSVEAQPVSLKYLTGKRVLMCVAHQDDETLFAGGLLEALKGRATVTVACFFRPAKGRKDTHTRIAAMHDVCRQVDAACIQYPFAVEKHHKRLWRFVRLPSHEGQVSEVPVIALHRHPLFGLLTGTAYAAMQQFQPDVVVTHNAVGEYGHREHIMLHHAVMGAAKRAGLGNVLTFGNGQDRQDLTIEVDEKQKRKLFEFYKPQWNGIEKYDFALEPETFVREAVE